MKAHAADNLGNNVKRLREMRGRTQQRMANLAGVPRPTWSNMESGAANPTLSVLLRVAAVLEVSVEELIAPPRPTAKLFPADTIAVRKRGNVRVRMLLPEQIPGVALERMELPAGARMTGVPHTAGTREYLTCERGEVELSESGRVWKLGAGDMLVFRGDQRHGYRNPTRATTIAYSVIAHATSGT